MADMEKEKRFWLRLSFINLSLVALMGFLLRSKILFSIPFLDYKNLLNAHSHLAFSGWVGLALFTFLLYDVLPHHLSQKKAYRTILWGVQLSSIGMAFSFPFLGYAGLSIGFSTLYILATYAFTWLFARDAQRAKILGPVRWLSVASLLYLTLSSVGPFSLAYLMATKSTNALLHRDALYTFLHLQYNGFFTLAVFAIYFRWIAGKGVRMTKSMRWFSMLLIGSVLPSLFLSLLWHNLSLFYVLAGLGCLLILGTLLCSIPVFRAAGQVALFQHTLAKIFWVASFISFGVKMLLTMGTIYRPLGNAVYGARPVIIGFLHLVFLGFVSSFILSGVVVHQAKMRSRSLSIAMIVFGIGILANEALLMLQGLSVLYGTNNPLYNWGLWVAAFVLFTGAAGMAYTFQHNKKATAFEP
jgi:hypothetical protein